VVLLERDIESTLSEVHIPTGVTCTRAHARARACSTRCRFRGAASSSGTSSSPAQETSWSGVSLLQCHQLCRAFLARCGVCHRYILAHVDSPGEVDQRVPRRHTLVLSTSFAMMLPPDQ